MAALLSDCALTNQPDDQKDKGAETASVMSSRRAGFVFVILFSSRELMLASPALDNLFF
jgi:hypothetical protein